MPKTSLSLPVFRSVAKSPEGRVEAFVQYARSRLCPASFAFEDNHWASFGVRFGNIDQKQARHISCDNLLQQPFRDFAKAFLVYRHAHRNAQDKCEISALRCLERSLIERCGVADITKLNQSDLDRSIIHIKRSYSGSAYKVGRMLEQIASFLSRSEMTASEISWRNPIRKPFSSTRAGIEAEKERASKLPDQKALDIIGRVFASNPSDPQDIFTSSAIALLLCAPSRASEIFRLRIDSEVEEITAGGTIAYGWRFYPGKGAAPYVKWIPSILVPLAREAFRRIAALTDTARKIASFYQENPKKFYRHPDAPNKGENEPLSAEEIQRALGSKSAYNRYLRWAREQTSEPPRTLRSLRVWVDAQHDCNFPYLNGSKDHPWGQLLFCMQVGQQRTGWGTSPILLRVPTADNLNFDLETRPDREGQSIFVRNAAVGENGESMKITSHQLRHLLNTIAQRGGLDQLNIALWSGRNDIRQNAAYDHMKHSELTNLLASVDSQDFRDLFFRTRVADYIKSAPASLASFKAPVGAAVHVTEVGFCVHDFATNPCKLFRDCMRCTEQVCIKGDARLNNIPRLRDIARDQLERARTEMSEGTFNADRWVESQKVAVARYESLAEIIEDTSIPEGSLIRLNAEKVFSAVRRVLWSLADEQTGLENHM